MTSSAAADPAPVSFLNGLPDWAVVGVVMAALIATVGTIVVAVIAQSGERAIRGRLARDVAVYEKLPDGATKDKLMGVIAAQVDALGDTTTGAELFALARTASTVAALSAVVTFIGYVVAVGYDKGNQENWANNWITAVAVFFFVGGGVATFSALLSAGGYYFGGRRVRAKVRAAGR